MARAFILVLILALGVGFYIFKDIRKQAPMSEVELPTVGPPPTPPDLERPVNITANLPEETKKLARKKIEELAGELKANPDFFAAWLDLGLYRKLIGDFEGAREAWNYAGLIRPLNFISFGNLGELYAHHLVDLEKAEENFLRAIQNDPSQVFLYEKLYELYRFRFQNDAKAKAILERGIVANPKTSTRLEKLFADF